MERSGGAARVRGGGWGARQLATLVAVRDRAGRLLYCNQAARGWLVGESESPGDGGPGAARVGSPNGHLAALDDRVLESGASVSESCSIVGPGGEERWVLVEKFPVLGESGAVVAIGTTCMDASGEIVRGGEGLGPEGEDRRAVEERRGGVGRRLRDVERSLEHEARARRAAEQELESSRRHLQTLTDSLPVIIVHYDETLRYRFVNRTYCEWRQVTPGKVLGRTVEEVVGAVLYERTRADLQRALAGERVRFEYESAFPDGHSRLVHSDLIPERDAGGRVVGVFGVGTDVTDLVELQRKLRRQDRLAAIGQLTATVAHELRTPLGTIANSAGLLQRHFGDGDAEAARLLERTDRNIKRCNTIIEELLSYTRVRRGALQRTDIDAWAEERLDELDLPEGVALHRSLDAHALAEIDSHRLGQALANLVGNALDATATRRGEPLPPRIDVRTRVAGGRVELLVTDNGHGIAEDVRGQVFEPLFSTRTVGVGLGLPLVRQIMAEHRGGADVLDTGPDGTTMVLWLPLAGDDEAAGESRED